MNILDEITKNIETVFNIGLHKEITEFCEEKHYFDVDGAGIQRCRNKAFYFGTENEYFSRCIIRVMNNNGVIVVSDYRENACEWDDICILDKSLKNHKLEEPYDLVNCHFQLEQIKKLTQTFILNFSLTKNLPKNKVAGKNQRKSNRITT